jgi:hypothetical protein
MSINQILALYQPIYDVSYLNPKNLKQSVVTSPVFGVLYDRCAEGKIRTDITDKIREKLYVRTGVDILEESSTESSTQLTQQVNVFIQLIEDLLKQGIQDYRSIIPTFSALQACIRNGWKPENVSEVGLTARSFCCFYCSLQEIIRAAVEVSHLCQDHEKENPGKDFLLEVLSVSPNISQYVLFQLIDRMTLQSSSGGSYKIPPYMLLIIIECLKFLYPYSFYGLLVEVAKSLTNSSADDVASSLNYEVFSLGDIVRFSTTHIPHATSNFGSIVKVDMKKEEYSVELSGLNRDMDIATVSFRDLSLQRFNGSLNLNTTSDSNTDGHRELNEEEEADSKSANKDFPTTRKKQISIVDLLHQFDVVSCMVKILYTKPLSTEERASIFSFSVPSGCSSCGSSCSFISTAFEISVNCPSCFNCSPDCKSSSSSLPLVYAWECKHCKKQYCSSCMDSYSDVHSYIIGSSDTIGAIKSWAKAVSCQFTHDGLKEPLSYNSVEETAPVDSVSYWGLFLKNFFLADELLKKQYMTADDENGSQYQELVLDMLVCILKMFQKVSSSFDMLMNSYLAFLGMPRVPDKRFQLFG